MHIYGIYKDGNDNPVCETAKETQIYRTHNKHLLCNTGDSPQYFIIPITENNLNKNIYTYN